MPKITTEDFISKAKEIHGDKYDYSLVDYQGSAVPVTIICPIHGPFEQKPTKHTSLKRGCPKCGGTAKKTTEEFIADAKAVHSDKYDYSLAEYKTSFDPVVIICPLHGPWEVTPNNHVSLKTGCPRCGRNNTIAASMIPKEEFVVRAKNVHGNFYDYSKTTVEKLRSKSVITCPIHGDFEQDLQNHILGSRCPKCAHNDKSKQEGVIENLLKEWLPDLKVERNVRGIIPEFTTKKRGEGRKAIKNGELDLYVPEKKLAIEYNGMFWHSRDRVGWDYHVNKRKACDQVGIRMITIWEADWQDERKKR